jgi:hypothetical protein
MQQIYNPNYWIWLAFSLCPRIVCATSEFLLTMGLQTDPWVQCQMRSPFQLLNINQFSDNLALIMYPHLRQHLLHTLVVLPPALPTRPHHLFAHHRWSMSLNQLSFLLIQTFGPNQATILFTRNMHRDHWWWYGKWTNLEHRPSYRWATQADWGDGI